MELAGNRERIGSSVKEREKAELGKRGRNRNSGKEREKWQQSEREGEVAAVEKKEMAVVRIEDEGIFVGGEEKKNRGNCIGEVERK